MALPAKAHWRAVKSARLLIGISNNWLMASRMLLALPLSVGKLCLPAMAKKRRCSHCNSLRRLFPNVRRALAFGSRRTGLAGEGDGAV